MEASKDRMKIDREPHGLLRELVAAIGSAWTSRKMKQERVPRVQLVSWAGRANTDSWFLFEVEQRKNRALYHYYRNQVR